MPHCIKTYFFDERIVKYTNVSAYTLASKVVVGVVSDFESIVYYICQSYLNVFHQAWADLFQNVID